MYIDSHCHLNMLKKEVSESVREAAQAQVTHMMCISVNMEDFPEVLACTQHPNISATVGKHPGETEGEEPTVEQLVEHSQHPRVVGIGETGLDYYWTQEWVKEQKTRFRTHIRAACAARLPLIVHTRQAREDTLSILREENAQQCGGVLHCFTESWEMAKTALDALDFYISFSGILTFKNAQELRDVAKKVPLDRLLIETDAPYLAPVPYRGKENQPAYVVHVAQCLAELHGRTIEEIAMITRENFFRLFTKAQPVVDET